MNQLESASLYTDFNGLDELRRGAKEKSPDAIKAVAQQFEAIFVQMMLKSMRDAKLADGLFDNDQTEQFTDLYDKQLANTLSSQGQGIGLAEVIARQLGGVRPQEGHQQGALNRESAAANIPGRLSTQFQIRTINERVPPATEPVLTEAVADSKDGISPNEQSVTEINTPDDFVTQLWPLAERAAASLGVDPKAVLAQAALETGWGRAVIHSAEGRNSHNLFNIKSGSDWGGGAVVKSSLEFYDGMPRQERSLFRSYGSYAESFDDYVNFLKSNPRYEQALKEGGSAEKYLRELQQAGYATDPRYAEKIESIMNRTQFSSAINSVTS